MVKEKRTSILQTLDTRTKVLGLTSLIAEALFLGALFKLPQNHILYALGVCAVILIVTIIGIVRIETFSSQPRSPSVTDLIPSPLTPDSPLLKELIESALQTMARAVSLPLTPEAAKLRVFIFRKEDNQLVCSHYWAPNPVKEMVGKLRFEINSQLAQKIAVVKAVIDNSITRTEIRPLSSGTKGINGEVSEEILFVLAAPIYKSDGNIWGTIDFDAGNDMGKKLISSDISEAAVFQLSQHLKMILSLPEVSGIKTE